jgi:hypothetical protein
MLQTCKTDPGAANDDRSTSVNHKSDSVADREFDCRCFAARVNRIKNVDFNRRSTRISRSGTFHFISQ